MRNSSEKGSKPSRRFWAAFAAIVLIGLIAIIFTLSTGSLTGETRYLWSSLLIFIFGVLLAHLIFLDSLLGKRFKRPCIAIAFEIIFSLAEIAFILYVISRIRAQR